MNAPSISISIATVLGAEGDAARIDHELGGSP